MQQCLMFIYTGTIEQEYLKLEVSEDSNPISPLIVRDALIIC